ncbi:MAG: hypothetical protein RL095_1903 [Verrucomicrobiota bacterium]|jgi:MFS family permease
MIQKLLTSFAVGLLFLVLPVRAELEIRSGQGLPALPDATGRAGLAAALLSGPDAPLSVLSVGGANFPGQAPWEGGAKVFHDDIYLLRQGAWSRIGALPHPLAYAAFAASPKGLIIAGGCDARQHFDATWLIDAKGGAHALAPLPEPLAYPAFCSDNGQLFVFGGSSSPEAVSASRSVYKLDFSKIDPAQPESLKQSWVKLPDLPGEGRILATAGALDGRIHLFGGCFLKSGSDGKPTREYLASGLSFLPTAKKPGDMWLAPPARMPRPLAACAGPAAAREGFLLFVGGDDGAHFGKKPQEHPGQRREILAYDPRRQAWSNLGQWPEGIVTTPLLVAGRNLISISGEIRPGVRTPQNFSSELLPRFQFSTVDMLVLGLSLLAAICIGWQIRRHGFGSLGRLSSQDLALPRGAWACVGLLFFVAMLNYLDRQLLGTMKMPICRDLPQTDKAFGLLTAVFLFIYSACSPLGGILADRYSRRLVILISLVVWSLVTWATGHCQTYEQLLVARALMGISEAFYIPAALALITDFHRGPTRSLATGLHMSGIYAGQALAGLGAATAESQGWRLAFAIFGLIGITYAFLLILFLKEPGKSETAAAEETAPTPPEPRPSIREILGSLFRVKAFWMLLGVMGCASVGNWFILTWGPLMIQEEFKISLTDSAYYATGPSSIAKYVACIASALLVDRWIRTQAKARSLVPALLFLLAGPVILCTLLDLPLYLFIACLCCQGLAQGALDANLMPMLRSHIDERFAATGYGFLNLVGAGFGGCTAYFSGALKDMQIPYTTSLAGSGLFLLLAGLLLWLLPKPKNARGDA